MSLRPLVDIALENDRFRSLATSVGAGGGVDARISATLRPYLLAALAEAEYGLAGRPFLAVTPDDRSARDLAADLRAYLAPRAVRLYPSRGVGYESHVAPPPHLVGLRIAALESLTGGHAGREARPVVVASAVAVAEKVPEESLRPHGFAVSIGEEVDLPELAELLAGGGYERADQVEERGQFAVRGGILDVYPSTGERAARIELFGDQVESIRWFSTFTQRSLGDAERLELAPATELPLELREEASLPFERFVPFLDLLPAGAAVIVSGAEEIEGALADHAEDVAIASGDRDVSGLYAPVSEPLASRADLRISGAGGDEDEDADMAMFRAQRAESPARNPREAESELAKLTRSGYLTVVAFDHAGEAERFRFQLDRSDPAMLSEPAPRAPAVALAVARLRDGFLAPALKLAVIPHRRLVHRRRPAEAPAVGRRLTAFSELRVGDHVVHSDHGIARFEGFETKTLAGVTRDYLNLRFRGEDRVFVPSDQMDKVSRYVGADGHAPALSKLGGRAWESMKSRARRAAQELAGDLLNLYAARRTRRGHAFSPDGEWQLDFEQAFPYRETADQIEAIEAVKADMEAGEPMDRLICGDVGYGKTEVALRAAHKAATDGKQVLMLVPTTVLAQQHHGTFRERFADTAVTVEMVSRFRKPAEARRILESFASGAVDVLLGTHRVLSRDVRARDLGLVIVDEEQRFGVKQKELLRQLKLRVDVVSLSATPIPRTLQMSLAGLRDISIIDTPPEGRRPVHTFVGAYDEELVRRAIEREAARGGQVFYLHNRVDTLHETAERLRALCPGVRFVEGHGQMPEEELEATMLAFLRGEAACLVATTIIESGLDIPNANTLVVERADQLGLAQAYQIRGRVGRSRERAYAYLLYPSEEGLTHEASARLATLADHTELGSGFKIAMRDLDIRGAGNLLGEEQSGHVAAVGFELYCQMLDEAVGAMRGGGEAEEPADSHVRLDVDVDAFVPASYVPFEAARIDVHRRIAAARERGELRRIREELEDRFGPVPDPVSNLLLLQRARVDFGRAGARSVEFRAGRLSVAPIELSSEEAKQVRSKVPEALYEWRTRTLVVHVPDEAAARFAAVLAAADAVSAAREAVAA